MVIRGWGRERGDNEKTGIGTKSVSWEGIGSDVP
jgi:hypothetical protein